MSAERHLTSKQCLSASANRLGVVVTSNIWAGALHAKEAFVRYQDGGEVAVAVRMRSKVVVGFVSEKQSLRAKL